MLNVSHVTKKYGKVTACDDLSFHLEPDDVFSAEAISEDQIHQNQTEKEGDSATQGIRQSGRGMGLASARKTFSTLGFGCFAILAIASVLQIAAAMIFPEWLSTSWGLWIYTFVPLYVIAVPVGLLIFRRVPAHSGGMYPEQDCLDEDDRECQSNSEKEESVGNTGAESDDIGSKSIFTKKNAAADKIDSVEKYKKQGGSCREKRTMKPSQLVRAAFIAIFLMYAGNILGNLVTAAISALTGTSSEAAITTYALADSLVLKILFMVILAPLIEEYVFRRQLIDRMSCYGEKLAVVTSALMFGLFHGNFTQFFYAFALGLLFGYIYLKTGKLRYSAGLHMGINFLGSIVPSALLNMLDLSALESLDSLEMLSSEAFEPMLLQLALYGGYVVVLLVSSIVGLVLLCRGWRRVSFEEAELELPGGMKFRTVCRNAGMIVFMLGGAALMVLSIFG
ncbi:MAG: CPBP family intramembrane metalloprotease [Lachnospiraceae bacterium]|nr:CPBP family intramembrane metalloprotease [Lachnospiraceae bacterium]